MVETLTTFKIKHVVRATCIEHAKDQVIFGKDIEEFSQKHINDSVWDAKEITQKQYLEMFDADNDYLRTWKPKQKMKFINEIDYEKNEKPHSLK